MNFAYFKDFFANHTLDIEFYVNLFYNKSTVNNFMKEVGAVMNISSVGSVGISVSDVDTMNMIDVSILKKSLDAVETNGSMLIQMMEQSINPNLGSNIDIRL